MQKPTRSRATSSLLAVGVVAAVVAFTTNSPLIYRMATGMMDSAATAAVVVVLLGSREVLSRAAHVLFASTLGDLGAKQGILGGINAVIVGNYLTTLGRPAESDLELLEDLQMPIKALNASL